MLTQQFKSLYSVTMYIKSHGADSSAVEGFVKFKPLPDLPYDTKFKIVEHYSKLKLSQHKIRLLRNVGELGEDFDFDRFLKYEEYANTHSKDTSSLEMFKLRFGDELGTQKFNEKVSKSTHTIESFIEKYKEDGPRKYREYVESKRLSLEKFQDLYGEEEGTLKWNQLCERNKGNHTLERRIEKHGEEEGRRLFEETRYKLENKNTLEYYINLYGEEEGRSRWNWRNLQNSISTMFTDKELVWKVGTPSHKRWRERIGAKEIPEGREGDLKRYYNKVWKITREQPLWLLPNFDKTGHQRDPNAFAIDHKISIIRGFHDNIPPEVIGNINNLQMLPHHENSRKCRSCYSMLDYCYRGEL